MKKSLKTYYDTLSPRDQKTAKLLLLGLPVLVYLVLVQPLYDYYQSSRQAYVDSEELLHWMHANKSRVSKTAATPNRPVTSADPVQLVSSLAEKHQITIDRLEPQGNNGVRVSVQNAPFDKLTSWLNQLQEEGAKIDSAAIDRTGTGGYVSLQGAFSFGPAGR